MIKKICLLMVLAIIMAGVKMGYNSSVFLHKSSADSTNKQIEVTEHNKDGVTWMSYLK